MAWHDEILPLTAAPDGVVAPSPALSSSRSSARIGKARWSLLCLVAYALISFVLIIRWESTASQCPVDLSTTSSYQRQQHFNNPDERPLLLPSDQCQPQRHRNGAVYLNSSDHCERFEHPIAILMREAEDKWKKMVDRQSRTLGEAVEEYRRRYGRSPPRGFDKWWSFASRHRVHLPDEYDIIHEYLGPFWAVEPAVLRQRILDLRVFVHPSFLFMFNKGAVVRDDSADSDRTDGIRDHLPGLAPMIEDLTLTYFCGDESKMLVDWATREKHVEASKAGQIVDPVIGTYWDPTVPFDIKSACSPYSRVGEHLRYQDEDLPDAMHFLGVDAKANVEVCENPEWFPRHGMLQTHRDPTVNVWCRTAEEEVHDCVNKSLPYTPLLSYTAISNEADIPIPALNWEYFESFDRHDYIAWPDKPLNKIVWRGKLTQQYGDADGLWRMTGRVRLHELAHQTGIKRRVRSIDPQGRLNDAYIDSERLAARYLDASAIGSAYQCASQCDPQRDWFDSMGTSPKISGEDHYKYKYVLDVDGNGFSGRFRRLLVSNSLTLKATIVTYWFRDRIQPWYHYVPVSIENDELYDIMNFFSGDMDGNGGHDDAARIIASRGRRWAEQHWRVEDCQAYLRLLLELDRLLSDDRLEKNYKS